MVIKFSPGKPMRHCYRQPIAVSDISVYICLIDIRSKSKEQLNERRTGLSNSIRKSSAACSPDAHFHFPVIRNICWYLKQQILYCNHLSPSEVANIAVLKYGNNCNNWYCLMCSCSRRPHFLLHRVKRDEQKSSLTTIAMIATNQQLWTFSGDCFQHNSVFVKRLNSSLSFIQAIFV